MAGGEMAAEVVCMMCLDDGVLTRAERLREGDETDHYRCAKSHEFGMDRPEPCTEPLWPPPPDLVRG